MSNELAIREGQECCYRQGWGQYRVRILKRWIMGDFLCFKLEILDILLPASPILKELEIGEVFNVGKKIGCSLSGVSWELNPIS